MRINTEIQIQIYTEKERKERERERESSLRTHFSIWDVSTKSLLSELRKAKDEMTRV